MPNNPENPIITQTGPRLVRIQADVEAGLLTLQPAGSSCRYLIRAAELYPLLAEEIPPPAKPNLGPGLPGHACAGTNTEQGQEHSLADLALFQSIETPEGEIWIRLATDPKELEVHFPKDLALVLFHLAGLPEPGENKEQEGKITLDAQEIANWQELRHPDTEADAGLDVLEYFYYFAAEEAADYETGAGVEAQRDKPNAGLAAPSPDPQQLPLQ